MMRPQLVCELRANGQTEKTYKPFVTNPRICNQATLNACQSMMKDVCDPEKQGTAKRLFADSPYAVAGKTGTARIAENGKYQQGRYRASFAGYFLPTTLNTAALW